MNMNAIEHTSPSQAGSGPAPNKLYRITYFSRVVKYNPPCARQGCAEDVCFYALSCYLLRRTGRWTSKGQYLCRQHAYAYMGKHGVWPT